MSLRTLLVPAPLIAGELRVVDEEAHHARTVLRLVAGDAVRVADGAGCAASAVIIAVGRHDFRLQVAEVTRSDDGPAGLLSIAVAPPKGDRFGDLVRGLTELGVGTIIPMQTERGERLPTAYARWHRIAGEALKQCRRAHLPRILPVTSIPALVQSKVRLTVLDRSGRAAAPGTPGLVTLVIGPEGGFTSAELATLTGGGASLVRLAGPILRIETAALAAAAVWSAAWQTAEPEAFSENM